MEYTKYTKEQWKGSVITSPLPPTLVTCGSMNKPNVFTVAWTGILCTQPPVTYISVRPERYSHELITQSGEFVINLPTRELVKAVDWCGVKTGRKVDKFKEMHLTAEPSAKVSAPLLAQSPVNIECKVREVVSPVNLECRVTDIVKLGGSHDMFIADIVGLDVAKELLDEKGKLCLDKAGLLAYAHGEYYGLGKKLGTFGYSVRKKKNNKNIRKGK